MEDHTEEMDVYLHPEDRFPDDPVEEVRGKEDHRKQEHAEQREPRAGRSTLPTVIYPAGFNDSSDEEEDQVQMWYKPTEQGEYTRFEQGGKTEYHPFIGRDFWSVRERRARLTNVEVESFPTVEMPLYTIATVKTMLSSNFGYEKRRNFYTFGTGSISSGGQQVIDSFFEVVRKTRIIAINTEGQKCQHPFLKNAVSQPLPLVTLALANLSGKILFFHDFYACPPVVKQVLEDYAVCKLGSGLCNELRELERVDVKVQGWATSGAVYKAFLKSELKTGLSAQTNFLNSFPTVEGRFPYQPYKHWWARELEKAKPDAIPTASYPHLQQNVRVPLAILCAAVVKFAEARRLSDDTRAFPLMFEALDLVRSKAAEDLEVSPDPQKNWVAPVKIQVQDRHRRLNDAREMTFLRLAQADFVECLEEEVDPISRGEEAIKMYLPREGRRFSLPDKEVSKRSRVRAYLEERCDTCGSRIHPSSRCPKNQEYSACNYPHDGAEDLRPHSLRMCPVLHFFCSVCWTRGHLQVAHQGNCTQLELRQRFLRSQPFGLLTSILSLALHPEGRTKIKSNHFRFGLVAQSFRRDAISRHFLRFPQGLQIGYDPNTAEREGRERSAFIQKKIDAYRQNVICTSPTCAPPVCRHIVEEAIEQARKRRAIFARLGPEVHHAGEHSLARSSPVRSATRSTPTGPASRTNIIMRTVDVRTQIITTSVTEVTSVYEVSTVSDVAVTATEESRRGAKRTRIAWP